MSGRWSPLDGIFVWRLERARLRALFTASTVESSDVGDFVGMKPEHVTEHQHGQLSRRQELESGHERQRDRLGLFVTGFWACRQSDNTLEEGVGVWLEPGNFAHPRRLGRVNSGHVPLLGLASAR